MKSLLATAAAALTTCGAIAASSVPNSQKLSWQENAGWMNWRDAANAASGVRLRPGFLQGSIWCENIGWIAVGDGAPGPQGCSVYTNASGADAGVNVLPSGELTGYAWGENVGWINFDTRAALAAQGTQARFDTVAGRFRGYAWGENIGWINLDSAGSVVGSAPPCTNDVNGDGTVDFLDLNLVLAYYGQTASPGSCVFGDTNGDGAVTFADLNNVLSDYGQGC